MKVIVALTMLAISFNVYSAKPIDPEPTAEPDRMIVLGDDSVNGFQAFPFTSINSLWCRPEGNITVSHIRISDKQLFDTVVDANPVDFEASCKAWLDYLNGKGPQPPINSGL
jgi:hypothetical protein